MNRDLLYNGRIFDGGHVHERAALVVRAGRVETLTAGPVDPSSFRHSWDLQGRLLAPGLIDLQVNGGGGVMFNDQPSVESIRIIGAAHRRFGTTGFLPTLVSDGPDKMRAAMVAVERALAENVPGVLGIHLEGPFLDPGHRGVHDAGQIRPIGPADLDRICAPRSGVRLVTLAPERVGQDAIRQLVSSGVIVAGGHSGATYEQVREALEAGLGGFTHLFNAMTPLTSREPGMVGAALADRESWIGLIADGCHVHPASIAVAVAAKPAGKSLLVTDAMATLGADHDSFEFFGQRVSVFEGSCRLPDGRLAGSCLDMIGAVRNISEFADLDRFEALRMASAYPARALGLEDELGFLRPGFRASMIELDDSLSVRRSWIDGEVEEYTGASG